MKKTNFSNLSLIFIVKSSVRWPMLARSFADRCRLMRQSNYLLVIMVFFLTQKSVFFIQIGSFVRKIFDNFH